MTQKFRSHDRKILVNSLTQRKKQQPLPPKPLSGKTTQAKTKDKLENIYETPITDKWSDYLLHNEL